MRKELKFLFTFLMISSILYILISIFYSKDFPIIGISGITSTSNNILNFAGIRTVIVDYDTIYFTNGIALKIILECTGVYEMLILSSIILSYPTNIKNKLFGIIFGVIIIYILNMIRLISISYVIIYYTDKFNFIDRYLWQISLVIFISLAYVIWLKLIEQADLSVEQLNSS